MELDLLSLASAQRFADHFLSTGRPLHILVNNAGIMMPMSFEASADGYESQFATNHLSHFLLTIKLLPVLERSAPARVVCVSSMAHQYARNGLPKPLSGINEAKGYV